ncbi:MULTISPECIES: TRAP transporter small permease [unclassified Roseitalea]|uniref:TRAP transporter small permease n=1 Tax=unclassified Roseitalea TaxID=2639107 RepID=UPI0027400087|nr:MULTISPECIES: TRAP transporter small permease [unclassified Roseitalea]
MTRPAFVHAVERGVNLLTGIAETASAILLWLIFAVLLAELLSRNLLSYSLAGSWELAAFVMSAMFYLGLAPALRSGSHVRVALMSGLVRGFPARVLEGVVLILAVAVSSYATVALANLSLTSLSRGSKSWELSLPIALPQGFVALGMGLFACVFAARFALLLAGEELPEPKARK